MTLNLQRTTRYLAYAVLMFLVALVFVGMTARPVAATQGEGHKVGLCHRTASDTNPYVFIEVDVASLPAHLNDLPGHPAKQWKTDGTFRGVAHVAGDLKRDYLATEKSQCNDFLPSAPPSVEPSPTTSPSESPTVTPTPTSTPTATPVATPTPTITPSTSPVESSVPTATPTQPEQTRPTPPATDTSDVSARVDRLGGTAVILGGIFAVSVAYLLLSEALRRRRRR